MKLLHSNELLRTIERLIPEARQCDAIKFALGAWPALWEGGTVAESKTKLEAAAVFINSHFFAASDASHRAVFG